MLRIGFTYFLLFGLLQSFFAQSDTINQKQYSNFLKWNIATQSALTAGSIIAFNEAWYAGYNRAPLHSFDDSKEWLQMDKLGHSLGAYSVSKYLTYSWKRSGLSDQTSSNISTLTALGYLTMIEILDGTSSQWGFSWSDMGANVFGAGLYWSQDRFWKYQRIRPKLTFHNTDFAQYRPELLGSSWTDRWLKDYNGQTYWLSSSPFIWGKRKLEHPLAWACMSLGYGGRGMLGGHDNPEFNASGNLLPFFKRERHYFLSLDIDWNQVPIKWKHWKSVALVLNFFKMPLPALEIAPGELSFKSIYY